MNEDFALSLLDSAKRDVATAAKCLTRAGETDEAAMSTLAVLDKIDAARQQIELRAKASEGEAQ